MYEPINMASSCYYVMPFGSISGLEGLSYFMYMHTCSKTVNEQNKQVKVVKVPSVENTKYLVKFDGV